MPLTLVLGPANSAKAGEVLGAYASAAQRGALLVVPTAADAAHYARELAAAGAVLGSVLTFGGTGRARSPGARGTAAGDCRRCSASGCCAGPSRGCAFRRSDRAAQAPGFATAAGDLIAELQRTLVTPQRFAAAMRTWAAQDERRRGLRRATSPRSTWPTSRELEAIGRVDAELYAWRALDALRLAPGAWGDDPVFFYGFDDLHPLERDAVETLARVVGVQVTVSLTYEAGRAALGARAEVVEELRPLAAEVLELPALDEHYDDASRAALHHLERNLFEPAAVSGSRRSGPRHASARGRRRARRGRARRRRGAGSAAGRRLPGEEIAVVYRSPAAVAPAIEQRVRAVRDRDRGRASDSVRAHRARTGAAGARALRLVARPGPGARTCSTTCARRACSSVPRSPTGSRPSCAGKAFTPPRRRASGWAGRWARSTRWRAREDPAAELARQARRLFAAPHRGRAPVVDHAEELDAHALATMLSGAWRARRAGRASAGRRADRAARGARACPIARPLAAARC